MKRKRLRTYTGHIGLLDPRPDEVRLLDIAHQLAGMCRWNGIPSRHYSVAQHCVLVSENVPWEFRLVALLHDAAETYLGDTPAPVANERSRTERAHEDRFLDVIGERFEVNLRELPDCVRVADLRARSTERRDVLRQVDDDEDDPRYPPWEKIINPISRELAMAAFISRFHECGGKA